MTTEALEQAKKLVEQAKKLEAAIANYTRHLEEVSGDTTEAIAIEASSGGANPASISFVVANEESTDLHLDLFAEFNIPTPKMVIDQYIAAVQSKITQLKQDFEAL